MLQKINKLKDKLEKKYPYLEWKVDYSGDYAFIHGFDYSFHLEFILVTVSVKENIEVLYEFNSNGIFRSPRYFRKGLRLLLRWCKKNNATLESKFIDADFEYRPLGDVIEI